MKMKTTVLALVLASASFSAFSAQEVARDKTRYLQPQERISVSGMSTAKEVTDYFHNKAQASGVDHYAVTRVSVLGKGSLWSGNAVLFKNP